MAISNTSTGSASRIAQNSTFEQFARAGYVMSGIVHLLVGYIALRVAFGGGGTADQSGAMAEIAAAPGGKFVLWFAVVAFVLMALWRLAEAAFGSANKPDKNSKEGEAFRRVKAAGTAVIYAGLALTAFSFANGAGKSNSGQNKGTTAKLMESTGGKALLIVAALVVLGVGAYYVYKGVTKKFLEDLDTNSRLAKRLGTVGYIAKGVAIAVIGGLIAWAVVDHDPNKAAGLDGAFKTLGAQPFGQVLLVLAAVGIAAYGLFNFFQARHAKM